MSFSRKLQASQLQNRSAVCLPLNVRMDKLPLPMAHLDDPMFPFARSIIDATQDLVCAYSIDLAYYLSEAAAGMIALERVTRYIPDHIPIIFDAKFGELGDSADRYAVAAFEAFRSDAVTFSVIPNKPTLDAFLKQPGKTVFLPCAGLQAAIEICEARPNGECGISIGIKRLGDLSNVLFRPPVASAQSKMADIRETQASSTGHEAGLPIIISIRNALDEQAAQAIRSFRKSNPLSIVELNSSILYESRREDYVEVMRESLQTIRDLI